MRLDLPTYLALYRGPLACALLEANTFSKEYDNDESEEADTDPLNTA